jgi:hypothetical protein
VSSFLGGRLDIEGRWSRAGLFPDHWGEPPTAWDSPERRDWIAANCRRDDPSGRGLGGVQRRVWLEERREDPEALREAARAAAANRMRHEHLTRRLADCP